MSDVDKMEIHEDDPDEFTTEILMWLIGIGYCSSAIIILIIEKLILLTASTQHYNFADKGNKTAL